MRSVYLVLVFMCLSSNAIAEVSWPEGVYGNDESEIIFHQEDAYSAYLILRQSHSVQYLNGIGYFSPVSNKWVVQMLTDELRKTLMTAPVGLLVFDEDKLQYLVTHQGGGVSRFDIKTGAWTYSQ